MDPDRANVSERSTLNRQSTQVRVERLVAEEPRTLLRTSQCRARNPKPERNRGPLPHADDVSLIYASWRCACLFVCRRSARENKQNRPSPAGWQAGRGAVSRLRWGRDQL